MRSRDLLLLLGNGARHVLRSSVFRRESTLVAGIALNDSCNLSCAHCHVSNRGLADMTMNEIDAGLRELRALGPRVLYVEGGEPFLWRDGDCGLEDVLERARRIGFVLTIVYTNGTFPIETAADVVFVSLDGVRETNDRLRGPVYDRVIATIEASAHPNILISSTITRENADEIEAFCVSMAAVPNVRGVFFYFYTPGASVPPPEDPLRLTLAEKQQIVERLIRLKRDGVPVLNSRSALERVASDRWTRPSGLCYLYGDRRLYRCCRSVDHPEVCRECGYLGYAELESLGSLRPSAVRDALRTVVGTR